MKKTSSVPIVLSSLIATLAIIVAGLGVFWQGEGPKSEFRTLRGETVTIQGHGLYQYETVSIAAQAIAQDVVTLFVGIPLLLVSMTLFKKGGLRGRLFLSGTLAYFLYTYASFAFGASYNILFLVYVSLFSLSLFAFIFALMEIDIPTLPEHFSSDLPRCTIAVFLFIVGGFLLLAWLGRIVPALLANQPPPGLEAYTTLVIQALDLGVVMPTAFLAGFLLWGKNAWGYLLSSVVLIKGVTLALAVSAMAVNMILSGVQVSIGELIMFPTIAIVSGGLTVILLKNVSDSGDKN
ncbi:MAG: hypothetical protein HY865_20805 [Chloroflexi bacterium]|nr:hypothetical protein [Chloroflexota bacterium]